MNDAWSSGNPYERFMGRWSFLVARQFLEWFDARPNSRWLDLGCGTGVLTRQIASNHEPESVLGVDSSAQFINHARQTIEADNIRFDTGFAQDIPAPDNSFDVAVSALMLNFVPQPAEAVAEMIRVTGPGGHIGVYLWDYAGQMQMLRYFWDAAIALDPQAHTFDEGERFPLCQPTPLTSLFRDAGLNDVCLDALDAESRFADFADFWTPFLGEVGPAPSYVNSLNDRQRLRLETTLRERLPIAADGSITLIARAWAIKGNV